MSEKSKTWGFIVGRFITNALDKIVSIPFVFLGWVLGVVFSWLLLGFIAGVGTAEVGKDGSLND